jgi:hypothetical protein
MWVLVATWLVLTFVVALTQIWLVVTLYEQRGHHLPYNGNVSIILTDSLANDIQASLDVTSESQYAAETVRGMLLVLATTAAMAVWLTKAAYEARPTQDSPAWQINVVGYISFIFVGLLATSPPSVDGLGPRRDYNPFLIWTVDATVSLGLHTTAVVLFLFLPLLNTLRWLWRHRKEKPWHEWLIAYTVVLLINLAFVGTQIASVYITGSVLDAIWIILEIFTLGCDWLLYSLFHLRLLPPTHPDYSKV